jgi:hypothetical protein
MIVVHIKPTGVERVVFHAESDVAEDLCIATWPMVRKELKRLDQKLRKVARKIVAVSEDQPSKEPGA